MTFSYETSSKRSALLFHLANSCPPCHHGAKQDSVVRKSRAAQYLRMSTEQQQYSIQNQTDAIREYASEHNLQIVRTYSDPAKSGVTLRSRLGLMQLLQDIITDDHPFGIILVYDVSRWGRFQDDDEAACYEFLCRQAGVDVRYVAESFPYDNGLSSTLFKNLKRAMAAEYSRDLSVKASQAKARIVSLGFWAGARAPYGFQRMVISNNPRRRNRKLKLGEHKNMRADRVILVHGPEDEVRCVKKMFALALTGKMGCIHIARELNQRGFTSRGKKWITSTVHNMLTSPVYAGYSVCNRTSQKLQSRAVRVSPTDWICKRNAFDPLVSEQDFMRVQSILKRRRLNRQWSNEEIVASVHRLLAKEGRLSGDILENTPGMPSGGTIRKHFGSCRNFYKLIGYDAPKRDFLRADASRRTFELRNKLIRRMERLLPDRVKLPMAHRGQRRVLRLDDSFDVTVLVCPVFRTVNGGIRWRLLRGSAASDKPALICRLKPENNAFYDFHLIPKCNLTTKFRNLEHADSWLQQGRRFSSISQLCAFINLALSERRKHVRRPIIGSNANNAFSTVASSL